MKIVLMLASITYCTMPYAAQDSNIHRTTQAYNTITLPAAGVLEERLFQEEAIKAFCQKTNLIKQLANLKGHPTGVVQVVEIGLFRYKHMSTKHFDLSPHRHTIIERILQDHPEAIEDLKARRLLS